MEKKTGSSQKRKSRQPMKRCATSLLSGVIQVQITVSIHSVTTKLAKNKLKKSDTIKYW